ncbi:Putative peptidoglycan binding domain-containing protein [Anaerocolumna jejuensis DSM 15929]|uniref:Putative peptidoglycan binding domain-containing protein n=1 Tax=Anaerocolumna jejuensis DSM 15929 TaxID=1121322 RepID=A0A1M6U089_9FIRM|nr:peptidoglycan-binding domain-containing protein [Anaerocolumna jejuensis]SHK62550.1 Putative peptidoglycan binding domain-containing protein [Anaerocolumna jejuensis DSM 15929]
MSSYNYNDIKIYPAQVGTQNLGKLQVNVTTEQGFRPIPNAKVRITYTGDPDTTVEELTTDNLGRTSQVELQAPNIDYSLDPASTAQPYSEYNINVAAEGFDNVDVDGSQILPDVTAIQPISLREQPGTQLFVIPPHTLYGDYPPKIAESEIKPTSESGEIVLTSVVIPEFVIVHDGPPSDTSAENYYIRYRDYIKNVASSEIYATWPASTITANVLAIMSFTLNRVYTEWYRNRGYNFTITSSTAFDHKWMPGRNIYDTVSQAVDEVFNNYLSRPNVRQPILTQYCDGRNVTCPGWMTQWGSKALGDQGMTAIQILRNFYGNSIYINSANEVAGVPSSWPGANLSIGSRGDSVRQMQEQLNAIAGVYSSVPTVAADGVYGPQTEAAVRAFQETFGLPANGIVDLPTWYRISGIYVAVTRIGELG